MHKDGIQPAHFALPASAQPRTPAFDLLRVFGAFAVVLIHVCGAYRDALPEIGGVTWVTTITLNGFSRWAVPLFIMISGALLLADQRVFELRRFVSRRVMKVLLPFLLWSVIYLLIAVAVRPEQGFWPSLVALPSHPAWYHLGFFYYFIPLYLLIPLFIWVRNRVHGRRYLAVILGVWMIGISVELLADSSDRWPDFFLYAGYLLLGYFLRDIPLTLARCLVGTGALAMLLTAVAVVLNSLAVSDYVTGQWFSYKTINVALAATGVFCLGMLLTAGRERLPRACSRLAENSLGIYLIHPIFLIPLRDLGFRSGLPWLEIPLWFFGAFFAAYWLSKGLRARPLTAWAVP